MGKRHVRHALALGHEVGVYEADATISAHQSCRWFSSLNVALAWAPQAAVVATPAATHVEVLRQLKPTLRVLVEKPLACSRDEFDAIGLTHHSRVAVGYQLRFHPHVQDLRLITDGFRHTVGIASLTAWVDTDGRTWPGAHYADALLEASHELDLALSLLRGGTCVYATASPSGQTWDVALLCHDGVLATLHLSTEATTYQRWTAVFARDGRSVWWGWAPATGRSVLIHPDGRVDERRIDPEAVYAAELGNFFWDVWMGCTVDEARAVLHVCDQARALAAHPAVA